MFTPTRNSATPPPSTSRRSRRKSGRSRPRSGRTAFEGERFPQTFVGRDATYAPHQLEDPPRLALQINAQQRFGIRFADVRGRFHEAVAEKVPVQLDHWYHVAAASDGRRLRLYIDCVDGRGYQLCASTTLPDDDYTSLGKGEDIAEWTVGRGHVGKARRMVPRHDRRSSHQRRGTGAGGVAFQPSGRRKGLAFTASNETSIGIAPLTTTRKRTTAIPPAADMLPELGMSLAAGGAACNCFTSLGVCHENFSKFCLLFGPLGAFYESSTDCRVCRSEHPCRWRPLVGTKLGRYQQHRLERPRQLGRAFPAGATANVNTNEPNIATITGNSLFSPSSIYIGSGANRPVRGKPVDR